MKNFILLICFTATLCALSACNATKSLFQEPPQKITLNAVNSFFIADRMEQDKNYNLNMLHSVYVGQPLIKRKTYILKVKSELVAVPEMDIQLAGRNLVLNLRSGYSYPIKHEVMLQGRSYQVAELYHPLNDHYYGILLGQDGSIHNVVLDGDTLLNGIFSISPLNATAQPRRTETITNSENTENFEIVFGGISNNQINFTYREYTAGDVAKTAFYQDLTYPLNSKYIRYKNMQIQIHQVTPEFISYLVLQE